MAKAGIVVAHYIGAEPTGFKIKAVNTGIARVRTTVVCADGDIAAKIAQVGFSVTVR
ncbi:MAG: hypothetical protein IKE55_01090 [Kiritimatiellae bacterium]|nr:hypothetical protein [Kiritimatiellia bacterium]